ncbi:MAG: hypothetical protein ABSG68_00390 [Thermoguttaceae bacterium]
MFLTKNVRFLLLAIWRDTEEILRRPLPDEGEVSRREFARLRVERESLTSLGVRWDVSKWLDRRATHCEISRFARTTQGMERAGLLRRCSRVGGTRMTHVLLTPEGERLAQELAAGKTAGRTAKCGTTRRIDGQPENLPHPRSGSEVRQTTNSW